MEGIVFLSINLPMRVGPQVMAPYLSHRQQPSAFFDSLHSSSSLRSQSRVMYSYLFRRENQNIPVPIADIILNNRIDLIKCNLINMAFCKIIFPAYSGRCFLVKIKTLIFANQAF